jgi:iron(III) transport system substrate-binding protein
MAIGVVVLAACSGDSGGEDTSADAGVVNVYSHRHYDTDQELFRRFTELTGIQVNVQTASADELITRLETEGADTEADILVTVDAGRLERAKVRGLLREIGRAHV